ncbi:MAG: response regulator [Devosiaceae bacterium]|nr:response regulator [Devosiaceae bacterium]
MQFLDMTQISILVADPNPYMTKIVRAMLRGFGISKIREASDGAIALEEFKTHQIDIAIFDYALATLSGVELTELLRGDENSQSRFVPIIMLSAYTEKKRVEAARDAGISEFLRKPLCASDLYSRLVEVIQHPREFVRSNHYFGPDRRRTKRDTQYTGEDRRLDFAKI